jgi:hypothetical protein
MNLRILAIGDLGNNILILKKFSKNLDIHLIDFPRKGVSKITYVSSEQEFFNSLKISQQVKYINKIKKNFDLCMVMSWAGARVAYLAGLNYVMYFTGNDIRTPPFEKNAKEPYLKKSVNNFNWFERKFYRIVFNNALACVTQNQIFHNHLIKYRRDGIRIDRIPVDTTIFHENVKPAELVKKKFTFFSPQRNGPEKGMELLWKALKLCKQDFEIIMIDWFDDRTEEEKIIIKNLLEKKPNQVKFISLIKREDMPRYYRFADAVLGQMRGGFTSGVEREAVFCHRVVISYSDPDIKYHLDGKIVESPYQPKSKDPKKIAEIIDKVVESEKFRQQLWKDEFEFMNKLSDPNECVKEWEKLFRDLFEKSHTIYRNTSKIKLKIINIFSNLMESLVYSQTMKKKNIEGWGEDEYRRLWK